MNRNSRIAQFERFLSTFESIDPMLVNGIRSGFNLLVESEIDEDEYEDKWEKLGKVLKIRETGPSAEWNQPVYIRYIDSRGDYNKMVVAYYEDSDTVSVFTAEKTGDQLMTEYNTSTFDLDREFDKLVKEFNRLVEIG